MSADEKREAAMAGLATGPSFDQLLDDAKFHYVVKREPLRANSEAWSRVEGSGSHSIPEEMSTWVGEAPKVVEAEVVQKENETAAVV